MRIVLQKARFQTERWRFRQKERATANEMNVSWSEKSQGTVYYHANNQNHKVEQPIRNSRIETVQWKGKYAVARQGRKDTSFGRDIAKKSGCKTVGVWNLPSRPHGTIHNIRTCGLPSRAEIIDWTPPGRATISTTPLAKTYHRDGFLRLCPRIPRYCHVTSPMADDLQGSHAASSVSDIESSRMTTSAWDEKPGASPNCHRKAKSWIYSVRRKRTETSQLNSRRDKIESVYCNHQWYILC